MGSIAKVFRDEMGRVARKESKSTVQTLKKELAELQKLVRALRREVAALSKHGGVSETKSAAAAGAETDDLSRVRFTSANLRALRKRHGISQREMAKLVGVSTQAVYLWERKGGKLRLRNDSRRALIKIRQMSTRDVRAWLESLS